MAEIFIYSLLFIAAPSKDIVMFLNVPVCVVYAVRDNIQKQILPANTQTCRGKKSILHTWSCQKWNINT